MDKDVDEWTDDEIIAHMILNQTKGEIHKCDNGSHCWQPMKGGVVAAVELRAIADEIERLDKVEGND